VPDGVVHRIRHQALHQAGIARRRGGGQGGVDADATPPGVVGAGGHDRGGDGGQANLYIPADGYFPLSPGAGLAVLAGWAAVALAGAGLLIRRRDA
jgi:hypothetical protein